MVVVGKGGVGKTTTAGALALAMADRGRRVHLLSTDPAHSLGDLFGSELPEGPVTSPCSDRLVLEELDAQAYAEAWTARVREPLIELVDRGTYLDREDVEGFLDLTLPGVDEVAAALRLAELAEGDAERIVVDTAPTGHALRMVGAGEVVASWTDAFEAMDAKARAVIEGLTRRRATLGSSEVIAELRDRIETFEREVLAGGEAVVVDRGGSVVRAETERLVAAIESAGLRVALRVRTGEAGAAEASDDGSEVFAVPFRTDLAGCDGLRAWGRTGRESDGGPAAAEAAGGEEGSGARLVAGLEVGLLLFAGKGGVGKSTCAAAAALVLARDRPVTLLSTDPAGSLDDVLGREGGEPSGYEGAGDLRVLQVEADARFRELRERYEDEVRRAFEGLGLGGDAALDRRVVASLLDLAPPGIDELFALLSIVDDARDDAVLVIDSAPTGHLVRLLALPEVALDWTRQLMRTLLKYRAVLGLDAFAEGLLDFAKRLKGLRSRLADPARSAAVVVTQPGPVVEAETRRLLDHLERAGVDVAALLLNRWPAIVASPHPSDLPVIRAPSVDPPPVGPEALAAFADRWSVVP